MSEGVEVPTAWLRLSSGQMLRLHDPGVPRLAQRYFVLHGQQPLALSSPERAELLGLSDLIARHLALEVLGDADCYSLLLNGARTRRSRGDHVHIVLSRDVDEKRWHFVAAQLKHLSRPVARRWARWAGVGARALAPLRGRAR